MIDIQSSGTTSKFKIDSVGINSIRYPIVVKSGKSSTQRVVANWDLSVALSEGVRGTHMSRFIEVLTELNETPTDLDDFYQLSETVAERLHSASASIKANFDWFQTSVAPISKKEALNDFSVTFGASHGKIPYKMLQITVAATALCPCSKAISDYGAHNQRSYITSKLYFNPKSDTPSISETIEHLESSASSRVYPLLKREDEKFVTEEAYDNPTFVEDLVRNCAEKIHKIHGLQKFNIKVTNQESIHNHDCYAEINFEL